MGAVTEHLAILVTVTGGNQSEGQIKRIGGAFAGLSKGMASYGAAAAVAGKFLLDSAKAASNLNEQVSASRVVFGAGATEVQKFAKTAVDNFGLSERAALEAANSFSALFKNAGLSAGDTAAFSTTLTKLGADISSLRNVAQGDVLVALRSGLTGELEPLRRLGIILNDATTQAKAMELGLAGANGTVDDGAKVVARYAQILEQTKDAQGDYARTADGAANSQRTLSAELENFQATVGQLVTPALAEAAGSLGDFLDVANRALGPIGGLSQAMGFLADVAINVAPGLNVLAFVGKVFGDNTSAAEKSAKAQKDYADALAATEKIQRETADSIKASAEATEDAEKATTKLRDAREKLDDVHKAGVKAQRDVTDAQDDLNELLEQGAVDAEQVAAANRRLEDSAKGLARAQRDEADTARAVADAQDAQVDAQKKLDELKKGANPRDLREAELDLADARRNQQKAILGVAKAQGDLAHLVNIGVLGDKDKVASTDDVTGAQLELADAQEQVERSGIATQKAQERLNELQGRGKEGSKELKDAQKNLEDSTRRVEDALRGQSDAHDRVAESQQDAKTARDELAAAEAGDPELADKVTEARQKEADALDRVAQVRRDVRDATEAENAAEEVLNTTKAAQADLNDRILATEIELAKQRSGDRGGTAGPGTGTDAALGAFGRAGPGTDAAGGLLRPAANGAAALINSLTININKGNNAADWQLAQAVREQVELALRRNGGR